MGCDNVKGFFLLCLESQFQHPMLASSLITLNFLVHPSPHSLAQDTTHISLSLTKQNQMHFNSPILSWLNPEPKVHPKQLSHNNPVSDRCSGLDFGKSVVGENSIIWREGPPPRVPSFLCLCCQNLHRSYSLKGTLKGAE